MCKKPFKKGPQQFGCGQCTPCRVNRSRLWVGRMMLEAMEHESSAFVTLTYDEQHVPKDGSLRKKDGQRFIQEVRERIAPRKLRYYLVGEYGDRSWRPHFHAVLFGVSPTEERMVAEAWKKGFVSVGLAEAKSMQYVAGYVVKKMTNPKDQRLMGRTPEFACMSLKPGIGFGVIERLKKAYSTEGGRIALEKSGWITSQLRLMGYKYPLGRYLSDKLCLELGLGKIERAEKNLREIEEAESKAECEVKRNAKVSQQRVKPTRGRTL